MRGDRAEAAQVVQDRQRIHAVAEGVGAEAHRQRASGAFAAGAVGAALAGAVRLGAAAGAAAPHALRSCVDQRSRALLRAASPSSCGVCAAADQRADLVVALQQQRAQRGRQRELAFAQPVEQGLDVVGEGHHAVQAEDAGRALHGVGAAEQRVEQFAVVGRVFELQQQLLERVDLLLRLADEGRQGLGDEAASVVWFTADSLRAAARWSDVGR